MEIHSQSRPEGRAKSFFNWMMASIDRANYSYSHHNSKQKKITKPLTFCNDGKTQEIEKSVFAVKLTMPHGC